MTAASPVPATDAATATPGPVPTPEAVPLVNPATGQPLLDPETGEQMMGVPVQQPTTFLDPATGKPLVDPETGDPVAAIAAVPPTPTPTPVQTSDPIAAADGVRDAVSEKSQTVGSMVDTLDSMAIQMGHMRISLWDVLFASAIVLVIVVGAWFATKAIKVLVARATRLDETQRLLSEKIITIIVWVAAFFLGIDLLGIDLTAFAVFSGAFGLAIGFGLQKTFGNLIAGIILLMDKSIKPGDVIAIADQAGQSTFGQIRRIGIRAVSITTRDQREYLIPNENLMVNQVENWSYSSKNVRIQVPVGISYNCDIKRAEELMLQAARDAKRVKQTPPPVVWLDKYGESSVDFVIHCWISDPEEGVGNVRSDVLKRLWDLFQQEGIEIPFPQRDINLRGNEEFEQLVAAIAQRVDTDRKD
ncbi:mechanosensitive ion channel [Erythrobacter sp. SDW2]|uniref:mechanosensitive ion channel family protein n=1 Tax=Erythrobacter sp. SDW2 TaxID=2907154 RepID=UPI001F3A4F26|nr:mechanosensitive ion channel domain-containing protein [Erythrobacter sp. SDW2]UIP06463.1 mechanosensitive ion channel [Erythrobacter sp. SDW2]